MLKLLLLAAFYLLAVVLANLSVAMFGPQIAVLNAFLFIGFDLSVRDVLHDRLTGSMRIGAIGSLIVLGGILTYMLNATASTIAIASSLAFATAGSLDAITYHMLGKKPWLTKTNGSNFFAAAADSIVFCSLAFGGFPVLLILTQIAAKCIGGFVWSLLLAKLCRNEKRHG